MNQEEYLKQRVDDQIAWYCGNSQTSQKSFNAMRLFEITTAAPIPLLTGYVGQCESLQYGVGFLGFCVAVVAGALGLFQYPGTVGGKSHDLRGPDAGEVPLPQRFRALQCR